MQAPVYAIAERAADLIKKEYNFSVTLRNATYL